MIDDCVVKQCDLFFVWSHRSISFVLKYLRTLLLGYAALSNGNTRSIMVARHVISSSGISIEIVGDGMPSRGGLIVGLRVSFIVRLF